MLGVPFAVPLAFLVAVTDLIPLIGATFGAVICIAVTPPDSARPVNGRSRPAPRDGDRPDDATPG